MKKYCVMYSYYENKNSIVNMSKFLKDGVLPNPDIDYYIVVNGNSTLFNFTHAYSNVNIIFRKNIGHDFGAWNYMLKNIDRESYDYFIFMNDTVKGPYLPKYIKPENTWYSLFCNLISDNVKLSGLSINTCGKDKTILKRAKSEGYNIKQVNHVQSMIFCTDNVGLNVLDGVIFNLPTESFSISKSELIYNFEIGMSRRIIEKGYDIDALLYVNPKPYSIWHIKSNNPINPIETMFYKNNTQLSSKILNNYDM